MESLLSIINKTTEYFSKYGVESPKLDAELLIAHVMGCNRMQLYLNFEKPMEESVLEQIRPLIKRRAAREPLQYIIGKESFLDFELKVDRRALIPRPETEELLELVFSENPNTESIQQIIDLGTGTGAIACALAKFYSEAKVLATDISQETLSLANENIKQLNLSEQIQVIHSDWFSNVSGTFDLIISNPPYLSDDELNEIEPEVANFEPKHALSSGSTGMEDIEQLIRASISKLNSNAKMYLEVGENQKKAILEFASQFSEISCEIKKDLNKKDRFVKILKI